MPIAGASGPRSPLPLPSHLAQYAQDAPSRSGTNSTLPRRTGSDFPAQPYATPIPGANVLQGRRQRLLLIGGLGGIALLSFVIALVASRGGHERAATTSDGGVTVTLAQTSSRDATIEVTPIVDAGFTPTVTPTASDAGVTAQTALLVVRTIPDGGTIKVGGQVYQATVQPGDPSGARTAQLSLMAGRYTLEADLDGYAPETREILLEAGENKTIEVMFTRKLTHTRPRPKPRRGR